MNNWISVKDTPPKDGVIVKTKILDYYGERTEQNLIKKNNLWFYPDMSMYVYYTPTHWIPLPEPPKSE